MRLATYEIGKRDESALAGLLPDVAIKMAASAVDFWCVTSAHV